MICIYSTLSCRFGIWKNYEHLFLSVFVFLFFLLALIFWQWAESLWLSCSSAPHFCPRFGLSGFHGTSSWSWTVFLWKELSPNHLSVTWKTWSVHMPLFCPPLSRDSLPTVRTEELSYLNYRCETHSLWENTGCNILAPCYETIPESMFLKSLVYFNSIYVTHETARLQC